MLNNPIKVLKKTELLGHQFTVFGSVDEPLFLVKEVADIIEYSAKNSNKLTNFVGEDEKVRNIIMTPGGNQEVWMLTEDGLYEVLMQSRKPLAKEFKKGVKQILHQVRTTGGYIISRQEDTPEEIMARALTIAQQTLINREERIKELQAQSEQQQATINLQEKQLKDSAAKVAYHDKVLASVSTYTVTQIAKEFGYGAETLNRKLRELNVQYKQNGQWLLKAKYQKKGYTKTITREFTGSDGAIHTSQLTVWTEKGREFIHTLLNKNK